MDAWNVDDLESAAAFYDHRCYSCSLTLGPGEAWAVRDLSGKVIASGVDPLVPTAQAARLAAHIVATDVVKIRGKYPEG